MCEPLTEPRKWLKRIELQCRSCHRIVTAYVDKYRPPRNLRKLCPHCLSGEKNLNPDNDMLNLFLKEMSKEVSGPMCVITPKDPRFKELLREITMSCSSHHCDLNTHCKLYAEASPVKFSSYENADGIITCDYFVGVEDD